MTTRSQHTLHFGRLRHFLAAIFAVLTVVGLAVEGLAVSSAPAARTPETRGGASAAPAGVLVEPAERIAAGQRLGEAAPGPGTVVATGVAANGGDTLLSTSASGAGKRLPMNMKTVCDTACKYDIDISDVRIRIDKSRTGYYGSTSPDGTITLTRSAFANEEQLARTLAHERCHVGQLRSGMGYPSSYSAHNAWEAAAQAFEDAWWGGL